MSSEIIKVMNELSKKFGVAIDWSQKNIQPYLLDLVHRIAMYEIWSSVARIVFFSAITSFWWFVICKKTLKSLKDSMDKTLFEIATVTVFTIMVFFSILSVWCAYCSIIEIVKALNVPELVVLQELQYLRGQ